MQLSKLKSVFKICAFLCVNLICKFYVKHIETNIDLQLMMCVLMYLEGNALTSVIYLETKVGWVTSDGYVDGYIACTVNRLLGIQVCLIMEYWEQ